jgi:hypothetical protein
MCRIAVAATLIFVIQGVAQQPPTIRVPVRLVSVPALVVSKDGKYIPGLSASDFRVTDNDQPQTVVLDLATLPVSLVVAVQADQDVRSYLRFIAKTGALLDNSLAAATGEAALITYNDKITVQKPFGHGDLQTALKSLSPAGSKASMIDAGMRAIELLKERPGLHSRVLVFIGQPVESGSHEKIETLEANAERENVQIYALTLPIAGKAFMSDSFSLQGLGSQQYRGG